MTDVTVEELEKKLQAARTKASYYKSKAGGKTRQKGESPKAKAHRLAANKKFNDSKRAMAHVVATITANEADHKDAYYQAYNMPMDELRELTKGHEAAVEKHIEVLQERRKAREEKRAAQKQPPAAPTPTRITSSPTPKPVLLRPPIQTTKPTTTIPPSLNDVDKAQLEKVRQVVSKRLEIDLTTAQAVSHVLAKYLKNYT